MHQHAGKFPMIALAVFAAAMALNLAASALALKAPSKRSIGLCSMIDQRIALGRAAPSPKMLIVGGSGITRGINARSLGGALGVRVQNFGLHASFGPGFELFLAKKALRPGDTVLLSLEYSAYLLDKPTDAALDALFGCGHDYLAQYSPAERVGILAGFPVRALWDRLLFAMAPETARNLPRYTAWGDPLVAIPDAGPGHARRVTLYRPLQVRLDSEAVAPRRLASFLAWARNNRISVMATWPNTMHFDAYRSMSGFADIRRLYDGLGIPVVGEPQLGMMAAEYMGDTQYHLNDEGIRLRTERLAAALAARQELLAPLRGN